LGAIGGDDGAEGAAAESGKNDERPVDHGVKVAVWPPVRGSIKGNPAARKIIRDAELTIFLSGWVTN
jgi:hypothetical protein